MLMTDLTPTPRWILFVSRLPIDKHRGLPTCSQVWAHLTANTPAVQLLDWDLMCAADHDARRALLPRECPGWESYPVLIS